MLHVFHLPTLSWAQIKWQTNEWMHRIATIVCYLSFWLKKFVSLLILCVSFVIFYRMNRMHHWIFQNGKCQINSVQHLGIISNSFWMFLHHFFFCYLYLDNDFNYRSFIIWKSVFVQYNQTFQIAQEHYPFLNTRIYFIVELIFTSIHENSIEITTVLNVSFKSYLYYQFNDIHIVCGCVSVNKCRH